MVVWVWELNGDGLGLGAQWQQWFEFGSSMATVERAQQRQFWSSTVGFFFFTEMAQRVLGSEMFVAQRVLTH